PPPVRRGTVAAPAAASDDITVDDTTSPIEAASDEGRKSGACVAQLLARMAGTLSDAEEELGRIDAQAGDGDHGQGMARGSRAAADAAAQAVKAGAGPSTTLALAGDAWAERARGTSGALWGVALRALGTTLNNDVAVSAENLATAVKAALDAVVRLGGAKLGDKTLLDAFISFSETLSAQVAAGLPLARAWEKAAAKATQAAQDTAQLSPKLGLARSIAERSVGHPDAGAISLAMCARTIADELA